jgi:serine/threonine protein kinase
LIYGFPPFYNSDEKVVYEMIVGKEIYFPHQVNLSEEGKDLLFNLLKKSPFDRLGYLNDATDIKQHKWFSDINWDDLMKKKVTQYNFYIRVNK